MKSLSGDTKDVIVIESNATDHLVLQFRKKFSLLDAYTYRIKCGINPGQSDFYINSNVRMCEFLFIGFRIITRDDTYISNEKQRNLPEIIIGTVDYNGGENEWIRFRFIDFKALQLLCQLFRWKFGTMRSNINKFTDDFKSSAGKIRCYPDSVSIFDCDIYDIKYTLA